MDIIQASTEHINILTPLFDSYRQFYKQPSDIEGAHDFLLNNLTHNHATVYIALNDQQTLLGFAQLYPTWESVTMTKRWILYDLFVAPEGRKKGVGEKLMNRAKQLAIETGAKYIMLETATDNHTAQSLYERLEYKKDTEFLTYILELAD